MPERTITIEWDEDREVEAVLEGPARAEVGVVLAHGAGAGKGHPFMVGMRSRLVRGGVLVLAFDYPYMAEGRKAPDRPAVLVQCHEAAAARLADRVESLVLAGKSMGGRIGSHVGGFDDAPRVFYGYPLVPPAKSEPRDTSHLDRLVGPMLFLQGERDRLGPPDLLEPVVRRVGGVLEVIPGADHSFKVLKGSGLREDEVLDRLAEMTLGFVARST